MTTKQIEELRDALDDVLASSGARGVWDASKHFDAVQRAEKLLASTDILTERSIPESEEAAREVLRAERGYGYYGLYSEDEAARAMLRFAQQSAKPAWEWFTPSEKMPPLHQQVIVELKDGPGQVCDVACYIGKVAGDGGKTEDRWILADVRLDTRQIKRWALIHLHTTTDPESAG